MVGRGSMPGSAALVSGLLAAASAVVALVQSILKSPAVPVARFAGGRSAPDLTPQHDARPMPNRRPCCARWPSNCAKPPKTSIGRSIGPVSTLSASRRKRRLAAGDFTRAVREYALAISFMMSEIRRQPARKDQRDRSVLDM